MNPLEKSLSHADPALEKIHRIHLHSIEIFLQIITANFIFPRPPLPSGFLLRKFPNFPPPLKISLLYPCFSTDFERPNTDYDSRPIYQKIRFINISTAPSNVQSSRAKSISKRQESWSPFRRSIYIYIYRICIDRWEGA